MTSYADPSRIQSQCCQCGFFVDVYRCGLVDWLLCEQCGTQHVLKSPDKEGGAYSLLAFADGPRRQPISPEMLAAHWEEEARRKKEYAERLLFRALPVEQRHAIRRQQAAEERRGSTAVVWSLVWVIPVALILCPLLTLVGLVVGLYNLLTGRERRERKKIHDQLDECLLGYRFVATVQPETKTGTTAPSGLTRQCIENLSCAHCNAEKSLVFPLQFGTYCPNCGAKPLGIREVEG